MRYLSIFLFRRRTYFFIVMTSGVTVQMTRYAGHEHCFWVHPKLSRSIVAWQEMATFIRRCVSLPDVDVSSLIPKSWATTAASNWKQMQESQAGKV